MSLRCTVCNVVYSNGHQLRAHMKIHTDAKVGYTCELCKIPFAKKGNLIRHTKKFHSPLDQITQEEFIRWIEDTDI